MALTQKDREAIAEMMQEAMKEKSLAGKAISWLAGNWQGIIVGVLATVAYFSFFPGVGQ